MKYRSLEQMAASAFVSLAPGEQLSVVQAAERYVMIKRPGAHVGNYSIAKTPYLQEPQDELLSLDHDGLIFVAPARTGKALALDTPIATPSGWTTMGDLRVGDLVFSEKGRPTRIVAATEIMRGRPCYRVEFSDGAEIVADADHEWVVEDVKKASCRTLRTAQMFAEGLRHGRSYRFRVPLAKAIQMPAAMLPLDPYFLGLWLGDGSKNRAQICLNRREGDHISARLANVSGYRVIRSPAPGVAYAVDRRGKGTPLAV